ncbi:MAG: hypothetical protein AAF468_12810 [Pseudomonadota bacterium]
MDRRDLILMGAAIPAAALVAGNAAAQSNTIGPGEFAKTSSGKHPLTWNWSRNDNFNINLIIDRVSTIDLRFGSNFRLRDDRQRMSVCAVSICLRGPGSDAVWANNFNPFIGKPPEIPGMFARQNILPDVETSTGNFDRFKYAHFSLSTFHQIDTPGHYRVEVWGRARSSAYPGADGEFPNPSADGNVSYDFDSFDADGGNQHQNHLTVRLT